MRPEEPMEAIIDDELNMLCFKQGKAQLEIFDTGCDS